MKKDVVGEEIVSRGNQWLAEMTPPNRRFAVSDAKPNDGVWLVSVESKALTFGDLDMQGLHSDFQEFLEDKFHGKEFVIIGFQPPRRKSKLRRGERLAGS